MKSYLHKFAALTGVLTLGITLVFGRAAAQDPPQTLVKNFLYALYETTQDPLEIAKRFISLEEGPNEFSVDVRYRGVAEHLAMLRKGQAVGQSTANPNKPIVFNPAIHKILPYAEVNAAGHLAVSLSSEQEKNVYVLVENGKPLRYFFVQGNKISSFDYMVKGVNGPAYFLGY